MATHDGGATCVGTSDHDGAKHVHGSLPQSGCGLGYSSATTNSQRIQKRSLRRAYKRLQKMGQTWYRGQLWITPICSTWPPATSKQTTKPTPPPCEHPPSNRLNASLGTQVHCQVISIKNSCVGFPSARLTSQSSRKRTGSLMTNGEHLSGMYYTLDNAHLLHMTGRQAFSSLSDFLGSRAPGRLIHCRIHLSTRPLDIIGVYQYVWTGSTLQTHRRKGLWKQIRTVLDALPNRNVLLYSG